MATISAPTISKKQLAANRANAQKCKGPTSPEGKAKSSQNAYRHGLTAKTMILSDEDRPLYNPFMAGMLADYAPVGEIETFLATSAAEQAWRLQAARAICNNILALGHFDGTADHFATTDPELRHALTEAATAAERSAELLRISLHEQRIQRSFEKYVAQLRQVQTEREAKRLADLEAARCLFQFHKLKDLPWNPADDGFVFSSHEIEAFTSKFHRRNLGASEGEAYSDRFFRHKPPQILKAA